MRLNITFETMWKWSLFLFLVGIFGGSEVLAQYPGSTTQPFNPGSGASFAEDTIQRPDLSLLRYDAYNHTISPAIIDTSVDLVHWTEGYYNHSPITAHLGTETSAKYGLRYNLNYQGLALGDDLFPNLLPRDVEDIIITNRPYWNAGYGVGRVINPNASIANTNSKAEDFSMKFYTSFARQLSLNFSYDSHVDAGIVTTQALSTKRLKISMLQRSKKGKRSTYIIYDNPRITQGLSRTLVEESGRLFSQNRKIIIGNSLLLQDSVPNSLKALKWNSRISFLEEEYSINDFSVATSEEDIYPYALLGTTIDSILYLNRVNRVKLENELETQFLNGQLTSGIDVSRVNWKQIDSTRALYPITVRGMYAAKLGAGEIMTKARFGLADASGDMGIEFNYLAKILGGRLGTQIRIEQLLPTLSQERIGLGSNNSINISYDYNHIKRVGGRLNYSNDRWQLNVELGFDQFSDLILSDASGLWMQDNGTTRIAHIKLNKKLSFGPIHTAHQFLYQTGDNDRILRPDWVYQGKLYFGFRLFKKRMETRWGVDAYVIPGFNTPTFWPVLGEFGLPASSAVSTNNILINPYVNLKVDQFYIFVKATNLLSLFNQNATTYWATGYLNYPDRVRFGFRWTLLD